MMQKIFSLIGLGVALISGLGVANAQKPDTLLLEYKISPTKRTMTIKDKGKWKTFLLEDILGKKVYTKEMAASRFGGEKAIELKKEELVKQLGPPSPLITTLPPEVKRKIETATRKIKTQQAKVEFEPIGPEAKPTEEKMEEPKPLVLPPEEEEKEAMRLSAIKALGVMKTESAVFHLKESLKEERPEIKRAAAEALAKMGEMAGLEALHEELEEEGISAKVEAIKALGRVGRVTSIPPLRKMLESEERTVSKEAAIALAKMGDERGITVLHMLINSASFSERLDAAVALAEIGDPAGIEVLKNGLREKHPGVRLRAVKALGLIGDKSILPLLVEIVKMDVDPSVRIAASESILSIKRKER